MSEKYCPNVTFKSVICTCHGLPVTQKSPESAKSLAEKLFDADNTMKTNASTYQKLAECALEHFLEVLDKTDVNWDTARIKQAMRDSIGSAE